MATSQHYENQPDFADPEVLYEALQGARRVALVVRAQYNAAEESVDAVESKRLQEMLADADRAEAALQHAYDVAEASA